MENGKQIQGVEAVRAFVTAGAAVFTLRNPETGNRFTFKVRKPEDHAAGAPLFVSVLTGQDNAGDYQYLGCIFPDGFRVTSRSRISSSAPSARAFAWAWRRLSSGADLGVAEVWHCGRCGKCGRLLTVPESIESGLGPVCARGGLDGDAPRARSSKKAEILDRAAWKARENAESEAADAARALEMMAYEERAARQGLEAAS